MRPATATVTSTPEAAAAMGALLAIVLAATACGRQDAAQDAMPAVAPRNIDPAHGGTAPPAAGPSAHDKAAIDVPPWQAALRIMDADGDGRVSVAEHAAAAARMFSTMDRDGDGQVTVDEMAATRSTLPDARGDTERALRRVDANQDGRLDKAEHATATRVQFDKVDGNHDGYLDGAELRSDDPPAD